MAFDRTANLLGALALASEPDVAERLDGGDGRDQERGEDHPDGNHELNQGEAALLPEQGAGVPGKVPHLP